MTLQQKVGCAVVLTNDSSILILHWLPQFIFFVQSCLNQFSFFIVVPTTIWQPLNDHLLGREIWILYRGTMSLKPQPSKSTGTKHSIQVGSHWWYFTKIDWFDNSPSEFSHLIYLIVEPKGETKGSEIKKTDFHTTKENL